MVKTWLPAVLLVLAWLTPAPAQGPAAEYARPEFAEQYWLVAENWKILKGGFPFGDKPKYEMQTKHNSREYRWPVDVFWLCDRINSNMICAGHYEGYISNYLDTMSKSKNDMVVELVNREHGKPLFVAGLWELNSQSPHWGSLTGQMDARSLEAQAFRAKLNKLSQEAWKAVEGR